jgi:hypothetical protein
MKIITAVASTTHIDRHNERMAKSALDCFAKGICEKFIPLLIEHDPNRQIGVMLYGKVAKLKDGEYALYVVLGEFENEQEKRIYKNGSQNTVWGKYTSYLADMKDSTKVTQINSSIPKVINDNRKPSIADLLEIHLDSTQIWTDGSVYKIKRFIASTGDLQIHVYPKDHLPAHFHVLSKQRGINARFGINNLGYINTKAGKICEDDIKKIENFFMLHPELLEKLRKESTRMSS